MDSKVLLFLCWMKFLLKVFAVNSHQSTKSTTFSRGDILRILIIITVRKVVRGIGL